MEAKANSLNIQAYVDARKIADLVLSIQESGVPVKASYSALLKQLVDVIWESWEAQHFEFTEDAIDFLASSGFSVEQMVDKSRGKRLQRVMNRESLAAMQREEDLPEQTPAPDPDRAKLAADLLESEE